MKPANELLKEWLETEKLFQRHLAARFKKNVVSTKTVSGWVTGYSTPQGETRIELQEISKGFIPASAWPTKVRYKNKPKVEKQKPTAPAKPNQCENYDFTNQDIDPRMIPNNGRTSTAIYAEQQYGGGSSNMLLDAV